MIFDLRRRLAAEFLGTAFLLGTVVGSGIMAAGLTNDTALALLGNTLPTGAILVVLITILGPISGAHFNPAISLAMAIGGGLPRTELVPYIMAQVAGALLGGVVAHAMFDLPIVQYSATVRTGPGQWLAEGVATFGLVATILSGARFRAEALPWLVGLYITAAYWFTSSTSFANPAVAVARAFSDTFAGIRPRDVPFFILAEGAGAMAAVAVCGWLLRDAARQAAPTPSGAN
ncbi:aquaporin family protein [Brevirhabdus pacifica]|uniref:Aquaporin family protein n=1 Tax=Brevirhabdus pacifica TaxID=1267768 RepID=A0A1U7DHR0_9RHOB|nr:MIP/aquaporin family protein [Brevirhabdus pacifica]APX89522.1 aquaporin family protein [Brevirhabdus pacifica]OWU76471.1 MIP family channel protein [Loktanella sp. 22II-4b]PJJ85821.1 glycerol uptake facilitator-like aquaporin [Brevirhabdus pacifica]